MCLAQTSASSHAAAITQDSTYLKNCQVCRYPLEFKSKPTGMILIKERSEASKSVLQYKIESNESLENSSKEWNVLDTQPCRVRQQYSCKRGYTKEAKRSRETEGGKLLRLWGVSSRLVMRSQWFFQPAPRPIPALWVPLSSLLHPTLLPRHARAEIT